MVRIARANGFCDSSSRRMERGLARFAPLDSGAANFSVDRATNQERQPGHVEPDHENHDRAKRSIGGAVRVEEMQVGAKAHRNDQPQKNTEDRAGGEPAPPASFEIWP